MFDKKGKFPDLVVIDGGKGQLSAAMSALKNIGVEIPCISLAKQNVGEKCQRDVEKVLSCL